MNLLDAISHQFNEVPDNIALQISGQSPVSYSELKKRVIYWEDFLLKLNLGSQARIVLLSEKTYDVIALYLASLQAGHIIVPVWKFNPSSRILSILNTSSASLIISDFALEELISNGKPYDETIHLETGIFIYQTGIYSESAFKRSIGVILFTSGSTGIPKGVAISVDAIHAFVKWGNETFQLHSKNKLTSIAPLHFDLSLFDIFCGLTSGSSILLLREDQVKNPMQAAFDINEFQADVLYATPTFLSNLLQYGKLNRYPIQSMKKVLFAGEIFHIKSLHELMDHWSGAEFYNLYGPTETNVCTWYNIEKVEARKEPYPIGKACSHMICKIWDDELLIKGDSVMDGYWNADKESTWHIDEHGEKWYKSGDKVILDESGNFEYRGRIDRMIKRRGYRVEPAEIETTLQELVFVRRGICLPIKTNETSTQIVYFFEANPTELIPNAFEWKVICKEILPEYFIPDKFIHIENFPETSSGKIDTIKLSRWNF